MTFTRVCGAFAGALVAGALMSGCSSPRTSIGKTSAVKSDRDRKRAPEFALKDRSGQTVHLSDYRGKVVLLDFWATWCGPCRLEIPWFVDLERKNKDKGFAVLGVSMDDEGWPVIDPFVKEMKVNYRVIVGNDETAQKYGGIDALPTTFLIDRNGKIAAVHVGLASRKDFEDGVEQLLQAPIQTAIPRAAVPAFALGAR